MPELLAEHTTLRLGGPAASWVEATTERELTDAVTAAAEKAGATVLDPPADQPWGERQAVLTDPDGHVFCLVSSAA